MKPAVQRGEERFTAQCEECDRTWAARGTINSRRAMRQAQKHADRTGHRIAAQWTNRR